MASEKPGSVQQESSLEDLEETLMSMENLDRSSPEMWPEKFPGISEFMNAYSMSGVNKLPYSKNFNQEDSTYMHQLGGLSPAAMISKVKELHDIAYQLGVEEGKEMTRGKYLNIFGRKEADKKEA